MKSRLWDSLPTTESIEALFGSVVGDFEVYDYRTPRKVMVRCVRCQYPREVFIQAWKRGAVLKRCPSCSDGVERPLPSATKQKIRETLRRKALAKIEEMIGKVFGKLRIVEHVGKGKYRCECSCGNKRVVALWCLKKKIATTCLECARGVR